nr:Endonuclease/exonuclease/phosphatase protein [Ipomoea batatas]
MFRILTGKLSRLYRGFRWRLTRRSNPDSSSEVVGKKTNLLPKSSYVVSTNEASIHPSSGGELMGKPIRVATFNAGLFSMAPAVPKSASFDLRDEDFRQDNHRIHVRAKSMDHRPKSILKHSPLHPNANLSISEHQKQRFPKSKLRVSINLPDNEISLKKSGQLQLTTFVECDEGKSPLRSSSSLNFSSSSPAGGRSYRSSTRTVVEVLREVNADVVALQDVKAEEEREMKPLSDLAAGLGMKYAFAESWAPEYGNAILSKWPIKSCKVHKIFDDSDFRNVMKATIDVPEVGEINFFCTLLDHLDENWRMKQINAIIQSSDTPHILAGGLNSLDQADYSPHRWAEIVKYYEEMGKPTPKVEVMKYLKSKQYCDAKDFGGECESVVMIVKGQCVQGTCKYGTRVDYIVSSPDSVYKFVPGSYSVLSSKGTSDHHIVKVDVVKAAGSGCHHRQRVDRKKQQKKQVKKRVVEKITDELYGKHKDDTYAKV